MANLFNTLHYQPTKHQPKAIVIGAHPDDAEIGAAGTLCYLKSLHYECAIAIASVGVTDPVQQACRIEVAQASAQLLGCELFWPMGKTLGHVEDSPSYELVCQIDQLLADYQPDLIITHSRIDSHNDHRLLAQAVTAASRKWFGSIYTMPPADIGIIEGCEFKPTLFINTHAYKDTKKQALDLFNYPNKGYKNLVPDRIALREQYFGTFVNQAHCEAFEVVRQIQIAS